MDKEHIFVRILRNAMMQQKIQTETVAYKKLLRGEVANMPPLRKRKNK